MKVSDVCIISLFSLIVLFFLCITIIDVVKTEHQIKSSYPKIELLFEYDGTKVYKFKDYSGEHYFTNKGECISPKTEMQGKTIFQYDETIQ